MIRSTEKVTLELELNSFTSKDGRKLALTKKEVQEVLRSHVATRTRENKVRCEDLDTIHDFDSFEVDPERLKKYTHNNKITYKHFVYHYLRNFYMKTETLRRGYGNSVSSRHPYSPLSGFHTRMIEHKQENKGYKESYKSWEESRASTMEVKFEPPSKQLTLDEYIREYLYFTGGDNRRRNRQGSTIDTYVTKENLIEFFEFILDTGMLKPQDPILDPKHNDVVRPVGYYLVKICYELDNKAAFRWLVDRGIDLKSIEPKRKKRVKQEEQYRDYDGDSFMYEMFKEMWAGRSARTYALDECYGIEKKDENDKREIASCQKWLRWIGILTKANADFKFFTDGTYWEDSPGESSTKLNGGKIIVIKHRVQAIRVISHKLDTMIRYVVSSAQSKNDTKQESKKIKRTLNRDILNALGVSFRRKANVKYIPEIKLAHDCINSLKPSNQNVSFKHDTLGVDAIDYDITKAVSGGYYEKRDNSISKSYGREMDARRVTFENYMNVSDLKEFGLDRESQYDVFVILHRITTKTSNGSYSTDVDTKFIYPISEFKDQQQLEAFCQGWLDGVKYTKTSIKFMMSPDEQAVRDKIAQLHEEACVLKKALGENCD